MTAARWIERWNRRLHYYVGLYLLLFLWFFSLSGLLLNHSAWEFAQFWPQRQTSSFERTIQIPDQKGDLAQAQDLMRQLDLEGEVEQVTSYPGENRFAFRVTKPGDMVHVQVDLGAANAQVERIRTNFYGVMHVLHKFNGVRMDRPEETRDWIATWIWSISMDAVALGIIFLVLSGLYMWYGLVKKRLLGMVVLGAGVVCCGFFVFALGALR